MRHHAQQRGQRAEEGAVARGGAADRGGLRAQRRQPPRDRRAVGAARELDHDLRARARVGGQHARGAHVGHAPAVVERAHGPDDAEARLAAARQLDGEGRAHPDAQRLREADADLRLVAAAQPAPGVERGVLEARVVAGEGDELDRLAQREGVGALRHVARRGVGHAGQRAHLGGAVGGQPRGEVVALAHRARVVAQRRDQRGEAEHEQHHGAR